MYVCQYTSPPSFFLLRLLGAVFFCALPTSKSSYPRRPGSLCTFILPLMQTQHLSRIFHVFSCPSSPSLSLYKFTHILITILLTKLIQHRRPPRGRPPETPWANFWVGAWPKNLWLPPDPQSREITPRQSLVVSPGGETSQLNIEILFNQRNCRAKRAGPFLKSLEQVSTIFLSCVLSATTAWQNKPFPYWL